jgi:hypothetical protein
LYYYEVEHAAMAGSGQSRLVEFLREAGYESVAGQFFQGSFRNMCHWFVTVAQLSPDEAEKAVWEIAGYLFDECHALLPWIDPFVRATISRVGDVDQKGTLKKLSVILEEFNEATQEFSSDQPSDGTAVAAQGPAIHELLENLRQFGNMHAPHTISSKSISKVSPQTAIRYKAAFQQFVVFLWRVYKHEDGKKSPGHPMNEQNLMPDDNVDWFQSEAIPALEIYSRTRLPSDCDAAKAAVFVLVLNGLRLNHPGDRQ